MPLKCLVKIENQEGYYYLSSVSNKIHTFKKVDATDILHFVIEAGTHKKITIV